MTSAARIDPIASTSVRSGNIVVTSLGIFLVLLFVYVLPPPYPVRAGVEWSWQIALTNAFLDGAQFGRDFVFTYGPWGFVAEPRGDPRIYPWLVSIRLLIAAGFASGVALIGVARIPSRIARWAWIGALLLLAAPTVVAPMLLFIVSTHLKNDQRRVWYFPTGLLVLSCALVMWVKFTLLIVILALCCLSAIQDLLNRKLPLIAGSVTVAGLGFWILAGQSLSNLPEYFRNSRYVAGSYSSAMALSGPRWQLFWGALVCFCVVAGYAVSVGKKWKLLPGAVWICLFCFLNFKQAFVRQDDYHVWLGLIDALLPGALILLGGAGLLNRMKSLVPASRWFNPLFSAVVAIPVVSCVLLPSIELATDTGAERVQGLAWKIRAVLSQATSSRRIAAYRRDLEIVRRKNGIQPIHGTADFFPNDLSEVSASGATPRLRPAVQGYASYNAHLTAMNAAFLHSSRRPDSVLFEVNPIDTNYPALEDPLSVLTYLSCYEPTGFTGKYLVLGATNCHETPRQLLLESRITPEQRLTVPPATGPIWAEIEVDYSALGGLAQFAFRTPAAELAVETETQQRKYRLTLESAKTGFLLSPVLRDAVSFARLYNRDQVDRRTNVRSIMVDFPFKRYYQQTVSVRLYTLQVPHRDLQQVLTPSTIQLARSVRSQLGMYSETVPSWGETISPPDKTTSSPGETTSSPVWLIKDGHAHLQVGSSSEGELDVNQGEHKMQVTFGVYNDCAYVSSPWSRVRFEVLWVAGASSATLLNKVAEVRGDAESSEVVSLALPGQPGRLVLRTGPEGGNCSAGAWWSDLDIR
jgi:hypothetical protein